MNFKACAIMGKMYGLNFSENENEKALYENFKNFSFPDSRLYEDLMKNDEFSKVIKQFLEIISICHTIISFKK